MKRIDSYLKRDQKNRRGIAVLWLVIWGSMFMTFFGVVLEIATVWQAQVELNNALDAGALSAVKEWEARRSLYNPGDPGYSTEVPREVGLEYLETNLLASPIQESLASLDTNYDPGDTPNENASCSGNFVFGRLTFAGSNTFDAGGSTGNLAVRSQATVPVKGFWSSLFGVSMFDVSGSSVAYFDIGADRPAIVRVEVYDCP